MALNGFFLEVEKLFASMAFQRMSMAEKGVYLVMMFEQWRRKDRSLPDDPHAVAELVTVTSAQAEEVVAAWPVVRRKFVAVDKQPERIQNLQVEATRRQQAQNFKKRQLAGHTAGKASAAKRAERKELEVNESLTNVDERSTNVNRLDEIRGDEKRVEEKRERSEASSEPAFCEFPIVGSNNRVWALTVKQLEAWRKLYPNLNVDNEIWKALAWLQVNSEKRKTAGGMPRFLVRWLNKATEYGGSPNLTTSAANPVNGCFHTPRCQDASAHTRKQQQERGLLDEVTH